MGENVEEAHAEEQEQVSSNHSDAEQSEPDVPEVNNETEEAEEPATAEVADAEEDAGSDEKALKVTVDDVNTAPMDFRFPTTNQAKHCYTRYNEYHKYISDPRPNVLQRKVKVPVNATSMRSIIGHYAPVNGSRGGTSRGQVVHFQVATKRRRSSASPAASSVCKQLLHEEVGHFSKGFVKDELTHRCFGSAATWQRLVSLSRKSFLAFRKDHGSASARNRACTRCVRCNYAKVCTYCSFAPEKNHEVVSQARISSCSRNIPAWQTMSQIAMPHCRHVL